MTDGGTFIGVTCIILMVVIVLESIAILFWIWAIIDCARNETDKGNNKLVWILVIVLTHWVGALIYYLIRIPERRREELLSDFEPVTVKEDDDRRQRMYQAQQKGHVRYSQRGFPLCPQCGIELEFSQMPDVCPYCRTNLI